MDSQWIDKHSSDLPSVTSTGCHLYLSTGPMHIPVAALSRGGGQKRAGGLQPTIGEKLNRWSIVSQSRLLWINNLAILLGNVAPPVAKILSAPLDLGYAEVLILKLQFSGGGDYDFANLFCL